LRYHNLCGSNMTIFFDKQAIAGGRRWRIEIENALKNSSAMLAFVTPTYMASEICRKEFTTFREAPRSRLLVPLAFVDPARTQAIYHRDDMWLAILEIQYLDISTLWAEDPGSGAWNIWVDAVVASLLPSNGAASTDAVLAAATDMAGSLDLEPRAASTIKQNGGGPDVTVIPGQRPSVVPSSNGGPHYPRLTNVARGHLDQQRIADLKNVAERLDELRSKVENDVAPSVLRVASFASKASTARRQAGEIAALAESVCDLSKSLADSFRALDDETCRLLQQPSAVAQKELVVVVRTLAHAGLNIEPSAHQRQTLGRTDIRDFSPQLDVIFSRVEAAIKSLDEVHALSEKWMDLASSSAH
jgi:TIR domain